MLPSGKFSDDQSTLILRDIKEKERLVRKKEPVSSIDDQLTASKKNVLPPLRLKQTSEVRGFSGYGSGVSMHHSSNYVTIHSKSSDNPVYHNCRDHSKTCDASNQTTGVKGRKPMREKSYDGPYVGSEHKHLYHRSTENVSSKSGGEEKDSRFASDYAHSKELIASSRKYRDFDAYLKQALRRREEDRLFAKKDANECVSNERRKERPKTAHYGRQRTQFDTGSL